MTDELLKRTDVPLSVLQNFIRYRNDPWAFISECCFTKDQVDQKNPIKKFPQDWPYLRLYCKVWQKHRLLAVPKSRRMTMSWVNIALYLHDAMFFSVRDHAFVSKKEDDAADLVKRAEFIFDHIPEDKIPRTLLPKKETRSKPPALSFPELQSKIQGFPMGADQLRQFTFSGILGDECAFWDEDRRFYSSAAPTIEGGGRMTLISSRSPSLFQRIVFDQLDNEDPIDESTTPPQSKPFGDDSVITWINPKNRYCVFDIHYTANPKKRDPKFKEIMRNSMPIKDFMVEYERNWEAFDGKPVYEDYRKDLHESKEEILPWLGLPLLCGWDFGLTPACVVGQIQDNRLVILREYVSVGKGIKQFCPIVINDLKQRYPQWDSQQRDFRHYIDPAGLSRAQDDNERSCALEMATQGLKNIYPGPTSWESRRKSVEHFLLQVSKDGPGFSLYPQACPKLAKGFAGAYKYPERYEKIEPGNPSPVKDEYSHPHDALQYLAGGAVALLRRTSTLGKIPVPSYGNDKPNDNEVENKY